MAAGYFKNSACTTCTSKSAIFFSYSFSEFQRNTEQSQDCIFNYPLMFSEEVRKKGDMQVRHAKKKRFQIYISQGELVRKEMDVAWSFVW